MPTSDQHQEFEVLFNRHSREVFTLAYARWKNVDVAMDITQETFLRLWKQWEARDPICNSRAWLLRVARNLCEDHGRRAFHRHGTQPPGTIGAIEAPEPSPLQFLERNEQAIMVRTALGMIPAAARELLWLQTELGYSYEQLAEHFSVTCAAIKHRRARAIQQLRNHLECLCSDGSKHSRKVVS